MADGSNFRRRPEVDGLTEAVDRAIQVGPDTFYLDTRLVYPPRAGAWTQMSPDPLFQRSSVGLNPAIQSGMVDRDAAVRQHQNKIAVADREGQIHRNAHRITSDVKCRPLNEPSCPAAISPTYQNAWRASIPTVADPPFATEPSITLLPLAAFTSIASRPEPV